jgi:hypothetical protein
MVVCPFFILPLVIGMSVIRFIIFLGTPLVSYLSHVSNSFIDIGNLVLGWYKLKM